jgi:hypothetical protein
MEPVSRAPHPAIAHIRRLQGAELTWRAERPDLTPRFAVLDLITSCGFLRYSDHAVEDDLTLLDRAVVALRDSAVTASSSSYEVASREAVEVLAQEVAVHPTDTRDLEALDRLATVFARVPPEVLLGRTDPDASSDLVCWNECHGLLEGIALPYRTASRISALAYLGAPDRYRVIDPMVAARERYESYPAEREQLDASICDAARDFLHWYSAGADAR